MHVLGNVLCSTVVKEVIFCSKHVRPLVYGLDIHLVRLSFKYRILLLFVVKPLVVKAFVAESVLFFFKEHAIYRDVFKV